MVKLLVTTMSAALLLNCAALAAPSLKRPRHEDRSSRIIQARDHWTGDTHDYYAPRGQQKHPGGGGNSK